MAYPGWSKDAVRLNFNETLRLMNPEERPTMMASTFFVVIEGSMMHEGATIVNSLTGDWRACEYPVLLRCLVPLEMHLVALNAVSTDPADSQVRETTLQAEKEDWARMRQWSLQTLGKEPNQ